MKKKNYIRLIHQNFGMIITIKKYDDFKYTKRDGNIITL